MRKVTRLWLVPLLILSFALSAGAQNNTPVQYFYDDAGRLTKVVDQNGNVATYRYDALNRRIFAGFGTQSGPASESTISFTYDAGNRLIQAVDSITGTVARI